MICRNVPFSSNTYDRNYRKTCLRSCSEEGFKAVNISIGNLQPLQLCEDQGIRGKLKKRVCKHVLVILYNTTWVLSARLRFHLKQCCFQ